MPESVWTLERRDLVEVEGSDSIEYLQGQLSQDIASLAIADSAWTFVLGPSGRVESWARVHRIGPASCVLDVEFGSGPPLIERLRRYLIRTDATIESVGSWTMMRVRGGDSTTVPEMGEITHRGLLADVGWIGFEGFDLLAPSDRSAIVAAGFEERLGSEVGHGEMEAHRIRAGVPRFGVDLVAGSVPAESGRAVLDASVSFTKGCYTGQELVSRMNSRGSRAPQRLRQLVGDSPLEVGSEVVAGGEVVGSVTSAAGNRALSVVMRRVGPGTPVEAGGVLCEVQSVPGDDLT